MAPRSPFAGILRCLLRIAAVAFALQLSASLIAKEPRDPRSDATTALKPPKYPRTLPTREKPQELLTTPSPSDKPSPGFTRVIPGRMPASRTMPGVAPTGPVQGVYGPLLQGSGAAAPTATAPAATMPATTAPATPAAATTPTAPGAPAAEAGAPAAIAPSSSPSDGKPSAEYAPSESSFVRLAHPLVADRLKLTDDQRKKIAEILAERSAALAKAEAVDRAKLSQDYEQKLAEVLTPEQRAEWSRRPSTEPKLRFNFRYQRWVDVLEWFARQADLSLVLDAPPPGTFNYSDNRDYSPAEAIDLLNSVLLTKGFTLIRHERMLIVVNLQEGIPEGLIPRVALADLDKRGKFELVSVLFPLGGREPNQVVSEIKPLSGPMGRVTPLPATNQILVMDTAGVMLAIDAVIQSMPPGIMGPGGPMEPPLLVIYPVRNVEPEAVVRVLRTLMPLSTFAADTQAGHITAYAGPTQQETVRAVLKQMESDNPPDRKPTLEVYSAGTLSGRQALDALQQVAPKARLSLDPQNGRVVAWAMPDDQKQLAQAVAKLGGGGAAENVRQVQTYHLSSADTTAALRVLAPLVPSATLTSDAQSRTIIALALPADQVIIKNTIEQLQTDAPESERFQMVAYPIAKADPAGLLRMLKSMFPAAQIVSDPRTKKLIAWAPPAEQEAIKTAIEGMDSSAPGDTEESFMVYPVAPADPKSIVRILEERLPNMRLAADLKTSAILAWGTKNDHQVVAQMVKQLQTGPDGEYQLVLYTLEAVANPAAANPPAPTPKAVRTGKGKTAARAAAPTAVAPKRSPAAAVIPMLKIMFPNAQFTEGTDANKLLAWARKTDHVEIKKAVDEFSKPSPPEMVPTVVVYTLQASTAASAIPALKTIFPDAQFTAGADPNKLIAFARPADHEAIKAAVAQLEEPESPKTARTVVVYTVDLTTASVGPRGVRSAGGAINLIPVLRPMFPSAQFVVGADPRRLIAWARPDDQKQIAKAIDEMSKKDPAELTPQPVVYALESGTAVSAMIVLRSLFPEAQFTVGTEPNKLVVVARAVDHELIKSTLNQISKKEPAETAFKLVVYTLDAAVATSSGPATATKTAKGRPIPSAGAKTTASAAAAVIPMLTQMFPNAKFSSGTEPNQLLAWARPADHAEIKKAVEELGKPVPAEMAPRVVVYTLQGTTALVASVALRNVFPDAQFTPGTDPSKLIAFARPADHEAIKAAVEQMSVQEPAEKARQVAVYTIDTSGASMAGGRGSSRFGAAMSLMLVLRPMFPDAQFTVGSDPRRLIAWARPDDQKQIKQAIDAMSKPESAETAPRVVIYTLEGTTSTNAIVVLRSLFPDAQFTPGADPTKLVAFARPVDHEAIKGAVAQMSQKEPEATSFRLVVYALDAAVASSGGPAAATSKGKGKAAASSAAKTTSAAAAVIPMLTQMFPNAKFTTGNEPNKLLAWARPADHAEIKKAVEELIKPVPAEMAPRVAVYTLQGTTAVMASIALRNVFPDAQFTPGTDPSKLIAFARPADHEAIKAAVEQMSIQEPPEKARQVAVYTIDTSGASMAGGRGSSRFGAAMSLMLVLRPMFPDAQFTVGSDPRRLIAWARPDDQKQIKQAIDAMSKPESAQTAPRVVNYTLENASAVNVVSILRTMFLEATFSYGTETNKIVVLARPAEHLLIKQAVEQMSQKEPAETAFQLVAYTLESVGSGAGAAAKPTPKSKAASRTPAGQAPGASSIIPLLTQMFPNAKFAQGAEPYKLLAWARPADHAEIKKAVAELSKPEPAETAPRVALYTVEGMPAANAILILKSIFTEAQLTQGADPSKVVAFARPNDQAGIKGAIEQMSQKEPAATAFKLVVYTLESALAPSKGPAPPPPAGPKGKASAASTALGRTNVSGVIIPMLIQMFPNAKFTAGMESDKLLAWARPADHVEIQKAVDELIKPEPPGVAPTVVVYTLQTTTAAVAIPALKNIFPDARFMPGNDPAQVIVFARPADHEAIKAAVERMSEKEPPETARQVAVYTVEGGSGTGASSGSARSTSRDTGGASGAMLVLKPMFPDAQFAVGADSRRLIVWARPAEQTQIKKAVEEISKPESPATAPRVVVYALGTQTSVNAIPIFRTMFPDATFSPGADPNQVMALARPSDHELIKQAVEQMGQKDATAGYTLAVYTVETPSSTGTSSSSSSVSSSARLRSGASGVIPLLQTMFPSAQFAVGADRNRLVVWARPADQAQIKKALDEVARKESPETAQRLVIYTLKETTATAALPVLQRMFPDAQFSQGAEVNLVMAMARPMDHAAIKSAVEQMSQPDTARKTAVYRFRNAEPLSAQKPLATLVPAAQIAVDAATRSLVVTASAEDHAKIKTAVDEMDRDDPAGGAPRLQVHRCVSSDATNLARIITMLYKSRYDVQVSADLKNNALVAVAPPAQQETIRALVEQADKGALADPDQRLELYSMKNVDPTSALKVLTTLFDTQGAKVQLSIEPWSNQLVAIARPEQQGQIKSTLEKMRGEERSFEIFQLEVSDVLTAQTAINQYFAENGVIRGPNAPFIDVDAIGQQMFVRATPEQLSQIRTLLVKMGEAGLAETKNDTRGTRTIQIQGDPAAVLSEVQRIWPQLRTNPVQILTPLPTVPAPQPTPVPQTPAPTPPAPAPNAKPQAQGPANLPPGTPPPPNTAAVPPAAAPATAAPATPAPPPTTPVVASSTPLSAAPITVTVKDNTITITSEDLKALNQFESLLRTVTQHGGVAGRNLSVFVLVNARATVVAELLGKIYRTTPAGRRSGTAAGSLIAIPDERLNALIVHCNRADRPTIEGLIKMLDVAQVPDAIVATRMKLIPVKNTSAAAVETALQGVFKNYVDSISVEEVTNSIVVMAPTAVAEEVSRFVAALDLAAGGDPARKVHIVPLHSTNVTRMQDSLDAILRSGPKRTGSSSRSSSSSTRSKTSGGFISPSGSSSSGTSSGSR